MEKSIYSKEYSLFLEQLRNAREEKGLSHRQLAEATKLSVRAIDALERDRIGRLPAGEMSMRTGAAG